MKFYLVLSLLLLPGVATTQWEIRMNGLPQPQAGDTYQNVVVADSGTAWINGYQPLWKSTNLGKSWAKDTITSSYGLPNVLAASSSRTLIYGTDVGKIIRTTDGGASWTKVFDDPTVTGFINDLEMLDSLQGYAIGDPPNSTKRPGFLRTTDGGATWEPVVTNLPEGDIQYKGRTDFVSPRMGWTIVWNDGIFKTTDGGQSWTRIYAEPIPDNVFFLNDSVGFFTSFALPPASGLYKTTDGGLTWEQKSHSKVAWVRWTPGGKRLWSGGGGTGTLYTSTDFGETWQPVLSNSALGGCGTFQDAAFLSDEQGLVVGMCIVLGMGEGPADVHTGEKPLPARIDLLQNYPNPFNPSTTIRYALPHRTDVMLTVFNTLGQQVATLVNGEVEAGYHEVQLNASSLASGVYFYRLQAGDFTQTRKFCLIR